MKFIFSYMKKYMKLISVGLLIKLVGSCCELLLPYVLEHMIDYVVPKNELKEVLLWGLLMLALAIICRTLNVSANRIAVKTAKDTIFEVRRDLFHKTMHLSGEQTDEFGLPSLTSRMTSDSYNIQNFVRGIQTMGVRAPIMLIGGIAITMTMDAGLASILCIMAPILVVVVVCISMKGIPLYDRVQKSLDDIVRTMRENITGIRVVKALSKEDYEKRRFGEINEEMTRREIRSSVIMSLPGPFMNLFLNIGLTLVVIVGANRVNKGVTEPGVILAFLTYFNMILMGVMALNRIFMMASKANASADRIEAVIRKQEGLQVIPEAEAATPQKDGFIVFDHVDFSYDAGTTHNEADSAERQKDADPAPAADHGFAGQTREKCLYDIDFAMKKGGSLGIIGATGCGKTTIINLLMRFYDADTGAVFVDGRDVRTYGADELHRKFGVVFQNDVIFADTIRENIVFGREVSEEQLKAAAVDGQADEFIGNYEDGFDHRADIHGANFSGGQRQRLLISRALAANPEILILDDSSSALDYRTDAQLRNAIREHHTETTMIVIAQRISSIRMLDDIIVLDEGRVVGHGTHDELMESCPMYRDIYHTQMGEVK